MSPPIPIGLWASLAVILLAGLYAHILLLSSAAGSIGRGARPDSGPWGKRLAAAGTARAPAAQAVALTAGRSGGAQALDG